MIFVCYPKCSTCQKAKKWLDEHHISYELRDIKEENPGYEELTAWHQRSGLPLKRFFNTSGLLYKSMGLKDELPGMSEEEMLQLLATDGMLVKRPLLVGGDLDIHRSRQEAAQRHAGGYQRAGHNDRLAAGYAVQRTAHAVFRRDAPQRKLHVGHGVELGIHRPGAEAARVHRAVGLAQLLG